MLRHHFILGKSCPLRAPISFFVKQAKGWGENTTGTVFTQHARSPRFNPQQHIKGMMVHAFSPSAEGRESLVQSHLWTQ